MQYFMISSILFQVDCHGVVTLQPDLTWDKPWYRVENRHRGKLLCNGNLAWLTFGFTGQTICVL